MTNGISSRNLGRATIITEAYSAQNLGDRELVMRSLTVESETGSDITRCLAVDPDSFREYLPTEFIAPRLFPRLVYLRTSGSMRWLLVLRWAMRILILSSMTLVPRPLRRKVCRTAIRFRIVSDAATPYVDSERVVAVGGGYLGDQYAKEALLTGWTWWWAGRLGSLVETMPMSFEIDHPGLGRVFSLLTRHVVFRLRDNLSINRARKFGLEGKYVPDLAFLNARLGSFDRIESVSSPKVVVLAPVGKDYLNSEDAERLRTAIVTELARLDVRVQMVAMHQRIGTTEVGGDDIAIHEYRRELESAGIECETLRPRSYRELVGSMQAADFVLSARMHAGIAGLCGGVPTGFLAYEDKHFALASDMDLARYVASVRAPESEIRGLIRRLFSSSASEFTKATAGQYEKLRREFSNQNSNIGESDNVE